MVGDRVILAVKYTPAGAPSSVGRAVGGFLRYVQYRDQHRDSAPNADPQVRGLLKYIAFRDTTSRPGQLFDADGPAGRSQRRRLAMHVSNSLSRSEPQFRRGHGRPPDRRRAVYRFVLSPERAEGLDLRLLTMAAMDRLEADAGPGPPLRWLAAEHRNTAHPHVHIVLAGMREVTPGHYRSLVITRPRLANMKEALTLEIERQRGLQTTRLRRSHDAAELASAATPIATPSAPAIAPTPARVPASTQRFDPFQTSRARRPRRRTGFHQGLISVFPRHRHSGWQLHRLRAMAGRYRRETALAAEEEGRRLAEGRER